MGSGLSNFNIINNIDLYQAQNKCLELFFGGGI
jgi:hypothetical protein